MFLGYKYFSGATSFSWDNPFGTSRVKRYFTWAQDTNGLNEIPITGYFIESSNYGLRPSSDNVIFNDSTKITAYVGTNAVVFNGAWQTSGFIGCYAEVLEDYQEA